MKLHFFTTAFAAMLNKLLDGRIQPYSYLIMDDAAVHDLNNNTAATYVRLAHKKGIYRLQDGVRHKWRPGRFQKNWSYVLAETNSPRPSLPALNTSTNLCLSRLGHLQDHNRPTSKCSPKLSEKMSQGDWPRFKSKTLDEVNDMVVVVVLVPLLGSVGAVQVGFLGKDRPLDRIFSPKSPGSNDIIMGQ